MTFSLQIRLFCLLFVMFFFSNCSYKKPKLYVLTKEKSNYSVVVLPFKNETNNQTISRIIYRILLAKLVNSNFFRVVEEGDIRKFLFRVEIYPGEIPPFDVLEKLKNKTGANLLISGDILEADNKRGDVKIALIVYARELPSGKLLWTTYFIKSGEDYRKFFHFGKVFSLTELANKMIEEIVSAWESKLSN